VEPAALKSVNADMLPDLQQLYFCPKCVRSRRPSLEHLSTLTCSVQNLVVALPEAITARELHRRATCWRDKVQQIVHSDEVRTLQSEQAEVNLMTQLTRSHSRYILQRGIGSHILIFFKCVERLYLE